MKITNKENEQDENKDKTIEHFGLVDPKQSKERPIPGSPPSGLYSPARPLPYPEFAAGGNDDDELDIIVTFKKKNGKAKAKGKA
jgi:hypothetical protein